MNRKIESYSNFNYTRINEIEVPEKDFESVLMYDFPDLNRRCLYRCD